MKNMKKLLQRAMVFTLTAAMLVGTPMTASAAGLVDLYSVSDGTSQVSGNDMNESYTGTVTNTFTGTGSTVLTDNYLKIIGLALDKTHVDAVKGTPETLTATVLIDGGDEELAEVLAKKIKWQVLYADGTTVKNGVAANKVLSISASAADRKVVTLNPRQGTVIGEDMIVKATIEGSYGVVVDEDGNKTIEKLTTNSTEDYTAQATVFIKEYTEKLEFKPVETEQYVKHTLDLSKYIQRTPETANDTITWTSDSKKATVNAAGVVTFKSVTRDDEEITITAVSEKGVQASKKFTVSAGTPATKVEIVPGEGNPQLFTSNNKKLNLDLGTDNDMWADASVKMYATVKSVKLDADGKVVTRGGKPVYETKKNQPEGTPYNDLDADGNVVEKTLHITDVITWKTNKATIADVVDSGDDWGTIEATGKALGTAKITATASSGKNASVSAIVKASLTDLWIDGIEDTLYSGQSVQLTAGRWHPLNKDAVKWSIKKKGNKANPNATINNKGVLTIKPKLNLTTADYGNEVTIQLVTKANKKGTKEPVLSAEEVTINLAQSSIDGFTVYDDTKEVVAKFATEYKQNGTVKSSKQTIKNQTTKISVPKGRIYEAVVDPIAGQEYSAGADTLVWKSSNEKVAKVVANGDGTAKISAIAKGNATVTVSGIRAENKPDGALKNAKVIKATFKVAVTQPTTSLTIDKTSVVLKATNKKQNVTFKAKQNKGAAEKIKWNLLGEKQGVSINPNNGKVTLDKNSYDAGDVFTVVATSQSGVTARATIQIVTTSAGVRVAKNAEGDPFSYQAKKGKSGKKTVNNATVLALGDHVELYPQVKVGAEWKEPGADNGAVANVEYSVSKKGIVQIIGNTVYRVGNGTVKITVKTADGKKCTLTIDDIDKEYTE